MNEGIDKALKLIRRGEGQLVEFKKKVNHPEKIIREVVAFANAGGGNLFIGVDDNGVISGLKFPEDEENLLSKSILELCKPEIDFKVRHLVIKEGIEILHYEITEGTDKPYFAFLEKKHRYGKSFIRVGDHSIQSSYEMRQILKRIHGEPPAIVFEEKTRELFQYFKSHEGITVQEYSELSGLNKKLASNKLIDLSLSGALKVEPRESGDVFSPTE